MRISSRSLRGSKTDPILEQVIPCEYCGIEFIPETDDDIDRITFEGDRILTCPNCDRQTWAVVTRDGRLVSGKA